MSVEASGSGSSRPVGSGRGGPVRAALRRALEEARGAGRMTAEHEVRALLATRYADLVDRASSSSDGAALLRAGDKLLELIDTLPIRRGEVSSHGDSSSGARQQLALVLDGPPKVGDSADG